jgi:hypothetical protein
MSFLAGVNSLSLLCDSRTHLGKPNHEDVTFWRSDRSAFAASNPEVNPR